MIHSLQVDSIILEFDTKRVLQDIYLKSETGKVTGLLGRNGSGKSCLMNIIYGELKANNKSIQLNGQSITNGFRNPDTLRYLPQNNFIPQELKVKRIFKDFELDFGKFITYFPEFEKYYHHKLENLSGGEARIVEIYSILGSRTKFCMLDEPFSQVMPVHVKTIKSVINDEKKNKGVIITDHLYEHVVDICNEVYVINSGKTHLIQNKSDLINLGYIPE